jgi:hypothetical protein
MLRQRAAHVGERIIAGKPAVTGRLDHAARRVGRALATTACAIGLVLLASPAAHAEPSGGPSGGPPPSPFPDANLILRYYDLVRYADYFTDSVGGVWFSTPLGLNCGIWDRGSFGCTGDIRGAPPGTNNIGWITGQIEPRYDPALAVQFPPGRAQRDLPPHSYIEYNGTRCATMADSSTFCSHGPFKFYVTPTQTWLGPP